MQRAAVHCGLEETRNLKANVGVAMAFHGAEAVDKAGPITPRPFTAEKLTARNTKSSDRGRAG